MKLDFRFSNLAGKMHVVFDDGRVREATEVEIQLFDYIKQIHDAKIESKFPIPIKNDRKKKSYERV